MPPPGCSWTSRTIVCTSIPVRTSCRSVCSSFTQRSIGYVNWYARVISGKDSLAHGRKWQEPRNQHQDPDHGTRIEAIVDEMLQVLRHLNLPHELVLVTAIDDVAESVGTGNGRKNNGTG